jgi:hypothetical protein
MPTPEALEGLRRRLTEGSGVGSDFGSGFERGKQNMLWTIFAVLLVLWFIGLLAHIGGGLIHLLLVVAAIVLIFNLLSGRRAVL